MPTQNLGRNSESENFSLEKNRDDNRICRQILESDPAIRVTAFIEGAEVTGYAETPRTKNVLSQSSDLRKQVGFWVNIVTEIGYTDRPDVRKHGVDLLHTPGVEDGDTSLVGKKVSRPLA